MGQGIKTRGNLLPGFDSMDSVLSDQRQGWTNITDCVAIYVTLWLTSTYDEYRLCLMPIMKKT